MNTVEDKEPVQGTVKWFNNAKGFGFINTETFDGDIFAHFSEVVMDGYSTLKAGQNVEFTMQKTQNGIHALNIFPLEKSTG